MNKIFCIGLNKTGTTSLHQAFKILGFKSVHHITDEGRNIKDTIVENFHSGNDILKGIDEYEVFMDWDKGPHTAEIFKEFDKQYPGSKFILNIRDLESWLDSREKHVKRLQRYKEKNPDAEVTWLKINRSGWEKHYKAHYAEARSYFKGRENDILEFDVTEGDGWEKLCPFLNLPIPEKPFPKKNVAPSKKSLLRRIFLKLMG